MRFLNIKIYLLGLVGVLQLSCTNNKAAKSSTVNASAEALPYYKEANFTPHWFSPNSDSLKTFHTIGKFSLINQNGDSITEKSVTGKIHIANFFFTICPGICPKMNANLKVVQDSFVKDDDVLLLSYSVTPTQDSVSVLKAYAHEKGVLKNKWHLLTGDKKQIYNLGRKRYFVEEDLGETPVEDSFLHSENFVLVDENGYIRGIYNGLNKTDVQQLIKDVKLL